MFWAHENTGFLHTYSYKTKGKTKFNMSQSKIKSINSTSDFLIRNILVLIPTDSVPSIKPRQRNLHTHKYRICC